MTGLPHFLAKTCIQDWEKTQEPAVRQRYGSFSGVMGICLNLLVSTGKFLAGALTGSLAMTADALNNLTDAGSSVVTLLGFRMAGAKADKDHPFGHGRVEYITGLMVSLLILLVGVELGKSSVEKIIHPVPVTFSWVAVGVLAGSILVKLWMWRLNRAWSGFIASEALGATAADSISDCVATGSVLAGTLIGRYLNLMLDGWLGLAVALFILYTGFKAAKETLDPLLGRPPSQEMVDQIAKTVLACPEILGIHDLVIHDYGPGRIMASLHAEVPMTADILSAHDAIDQVERELRDKYQIHAVLHMDPIATDDKEVTEMRSKVAELVKDIDERLTIHDFRMTKGPLHTNLIFDVVLPYEVPFTPDGLTKVIRHRVEELDGHYYAVIEIDQPYAGS